jgi:hypothetical protein
MELEPKIETITEKKLVGKRIITSFSNNRTFELWRTFMPRRKEIQNSSVQNYIPYKFMNPRFLIISNQVEFITIMWFDSIDSVKVFAGEDFENAVVPKKAQLLLSHFDKQSQHYQVRSSDKIMG